MQDEIKKNNDPFFCKTEIITEKRKKISRIISVRGKFIFKIAFFSFENTNFLKK